MIFSFGNVAYGFFIQFAECLPWRAGSCFRADALQSKVASLDFEFGALALGIGTSEVEHVMATQTMWMIKPKSMRYPLQFP